MNDETLDKILDFQGDIHSSIEFLLSIYNEVGFQQNINLKALSNPDNAFGNAIRSYRSKGLITPVGKNGTRLILNGVNILQYLLIQRSLMAGAKLADLKEVIPNLAEQELIKLVQLKSISMNVLGIGRHKDKIEANHLPENRTRVPNWHLLNIRPGIQAFIDSTRYSEREINEVEAAIKNIKFKNS